MAGGNVSINAQNDITHQTLIGGILTDDSSHELPVNWLYRRGYVDPGDRAIRSGYSQQWRNGRRFHDSWWVDFSNFFEGVATLGGGNVSLSAGRNVSNVDAAAPTNARMPARNASGPLAPNAGALVELGGGDVTVQAGGNIDGGVYYVERGAGKLDAGGSIVTNQTRSPSLGLAVSPPVTLDEHTWLPTTLFLGKGSFDVAARGDVLLGPVANVFLAAGRHQQQLLVQDELLDLRSRRQRERKFADGIGQFARRRHPGQQRVCSVAGDLAGPGVAIEHSTQQSLSYFQPWLRLDVTNVQPFTTLATVSPGSLFATSFSGDVNVVGNLTLSPSATGTIDLVAREGHQWFAAERFRRGCTEPGTKLRSTSPTPIRPEFLESIRLSLFARRWQILSRPDRTRRSTNVFLNANQRDFS